MDYKIRRGPDGKEVVLDTAKYPSITAVEFTELVIKEFMGLPVATALFKFREVPSEKQLIISIDWENLVIYPVNPPEPAPRVWASC